MRKSIQTWVSEIHKFEEKGQSCHCIQDFMSDFVSSCFCSLMLVPIHLDTVSNQHTRSKFRHVNVSLVLFCFCFFLAQPWRDEARHKAGWIKVERGREEDADRGRKQRPDRLDEHQGSVYTGAARWTVGWLAKMKEDIPLIQLRVRVQEHLVTFRVTVISSKT